MKRFLALLVIALCSPWSLLADGFIVVEGPVHHGPIPPPGYIRVYDFAPLEVTYHHVNVKIDGQIATTTVDEEFYNPNSERLEGTYLFPVPKGAQIDKFTMEIGGNTVTAELLPADKARRIYEDIVRRMRDPALLEYADRDVFKVRVFPLEPRAGKHITLTYSQVLPSDNGLVSYVYPLNTEKFSAKAVKNVSVKIDLRSPRPLKTIYSPSHSVEIKRDGASRATVVYEANDVRPDTDFALYFAPQKDELGVNLLASRIRGEDGYFLLLASPGIDVKETEVAAKDVAFVLDTSGSMTGQKIQQAKKALQFCIDNLNDNDRFEIIRFSSEVEPLFDKLVDASEHNRTAANDFVKKLKAIGGTAIDEALHKALSLHAGAANRPFVVVFLTDGQPTIGETRAETILDHVKQWNESGTRVFCFGLGTDVNTHLLDKIAEATRAANQYVLPDEDLEVKVSNFFSRIKEPVLANPTLTFTGDVRVTKLYPAPLPDLFKGEQLVVAGRFSGHGSSAFVIAGTVNGKTRKFSQDVKFPEETAENEFIPRLWATRRVGYLLDEIRLHGETAEVRDEVTGLARQYGIVTPYTAYLIVEDEAKRGVPLTMQTLPSLSRDARARDVATANWDSFREESVGDKAVAGANYGYVLKNVDNVGGGGFGGGGGGGRAMAEGNRALGLPAAPVAMTATPAADATVRLAQYSQQAQGQFVAGRNAFQNGNQWTDSAVQNTQNAKHRRIAFNSTEYFELATQQPKALPWLALGQNVQFVLGDTIYEIYE